MAHLHLLLLLLLLLPTIYDGLCSAYSSASVPEHPSFDLSSCEFSSPSSPSPKRVIDISHSYRPDLPVWDAVTGLDSVIKLVASIANGSIANQSEMKLGVHSGTHADAPSHIFQEYYEAGNHVDTLDLDVLNGQALVVDVPRETNLTGV